MADLVLTPLENIESQTSFLQALNANLDAIETSVNSKIDRLESNGQLEVPIDMNSNRIMNLPSPGSGTDAARWIDVYSASVVTEYAIPNVIGNEDKFLTTDGLTLIWADSPVGLVAANNLSDLTNAGTARTNLGLGTVVTYDVGTSGTKVGLLSTGNVWSSAQTFQALASFTGGGNITGATEWRLQTTGLTTLSADSLGFRGAPQNLQDAAYTFVLDDAGKGVSHSSASTHVWTIPPNASVAFPIHTVIPLDNYGSGAVTVTRGAGVTLRANGSGTSADIALSQYYVRTLYKQGTNTWVLL